MRGSWRSGIIVLACIAAAGACAGSCSGQKAGDSAGQPGSSPDAGYKWARSPRKGRTLTREEAKSAGITDTMPGEKSAWMSTAREAEAIEVDDAELRKLLAGQEPNFEVLLRDSPRAVKTFKPGVVANGAFDYALAFDNGEYFGYIAKPAKAADPMIAVYNDHGTQNGWPCLNRVAAWYSSKGQLAKPEFLFARVEKLHFEKIGMSWYVCRAG